MCREGSSCKLNQVNFCISDHMQYPYIRTDFWVINKENLAIDVRLLNFSIWTSVDHVMVILPRSALLDLVESVWPVRVN